MKYYTCSCSYRTKKKSTITFFLKKRCIYSYDLFWLFSEQFYFPLLLLIYLNLESLSLVSEDEIGSIFPAHYVLYILLCTNSGWVSGHQNLLKFILWLQESKKCKTVFRKVIFSENFFFFTKQSFKKNCKGLHTMSQILLCLFCSYIPLILHRSCSALESKQNKAILSIKNTTG